MGPAVHQHLERRVRELLDGLQIETRIVTPVESWSHATWLTPDVAVRYHVIGPVGRLEHEARVAARLPPAALFPKVVAVGRDGDHDWLVTERVPGVPLAEAWPTLSSDEREAAIHEAAAALRAVHFSSAVDLVPPGLFGGAPVFSRDQFIDVLTRAAPPELVESIAELGGAITDGATVMAHGDFSINQFMHDRGRIAGLLDLEMSHAEAPDWDLVPFLHFCADPVRAVGESRLEPMCDPEHYRLAPRWLRDAYPEMFEAPRLRERIRVHSMMYEVASFQARPDRLVWMREILDGRGAAEAILPS